MDKRKILKTAAWTVAAALALWVFAALVLPPVLPFLLAFLLSAATEKPALYLARRAGLPRGLAGGLCILAAYLLLGAALFFLGKTLLRELGAFLRELPSLAEKVLYLLDDLRFSLQARLSRLPDGVGAALSAAADEFLSGGAGLARTLPAKMLSAATAAAGKLPSFLLFLVTTVVASFLTAGVFDRLKPAASRLLPRPWRQRMTSLWRRVSKAAGGWLKAEAKLVGVTFAIVTLGLMLLRRPYPLLFGAVIALVDLLPVLGTGTVLIPWGLAQLLQGNTVTGVGLLVLYGVAAVTRLTLEPRFLGRQMGIPPLLTLASVYIGYRVAGLWGLLLTPVAASVAVQVCRFGKKE